MEEARPLSALKCLASFLVPKVKKQADKQSSYTAIPNLLIDTPVRITRYTYIIHVASYYFCYLAEFYFIFRVCGLVQQSPLHCPTV